MKFKNIIVKNFRNFKEISISLDNKNVFFGLNDVGKTNFLYALRYIFDREVRKNGFQESDYHQKITSVPIEIILKIDISDDDEDSQKMIAKVKGGLTSSDKNIYIKLIGEYDSSNEIGNPILFWGGKVDELVEMNTRGYYLDIDYVFNTIYIDAYVDIYSLFKKNYKKLIVNDEESDDDLEILNNIKAIVEALNADISNLSGIKQFERDATEEYTKYKKNEDISISVKSEIAIKGLYSNIIPYIKSNDEDTLYPTSGEGRKKLLVYSIYDILAKLSQKKMINIYLIEEPENHLHRNMQVSISKTIFNDKNYKYLFMSTHSPYILNEMDSVNLVRIYNEGGIFSESILYEVPNDFKNNRRFLNASLSEAIFSNKVLLVEGPSEAILFEKVLNEIDEEFYCNGIYILSVNGIGFQNYYKIFDELKIFNIIKTDNDLRNSPEGYYPLGFSRINGYISDDHLPLDCISTNSTETKRKLYDSNISKIKVISDKYKIFLSRCSLEEDLDEAIHDKLVEYIGENPVEYLKKAKSVNMVELVNKLTKADCERIFNHSNFECLKELLK